MTRELQELHRRVRELEAENARLKQERRMAPEPAGADGSGAALRHIEQELDGSQQRYRQLFEVSPDAILVHDEETILMANAAAARLLGAAEPEQLVGRSLFDFIEEAEAPVIKSMIRRLLSEEQLSTQPLRHHIRRLDGTSVEVEAAGCITRLSGRPCIQVVGRVLSARQQSEAERHLSLQRLQKLVEATFEGIAFSKQGILLDMNRQYADMLGYTRAELLGKPVAMVVAPESQALVAEAIRQRRTEPYEYIALRRDGTRFPAEVRAQNLSEEQGAIRVVAVRDITDRKHGEEQRLELERRLSHAQKLESLGVMAGGIAHEFNNLLAVIMGNLELGLDDLTPLSPAYARIENAMQASQRAARVSRQMLVYSGRSPFKAVAFDLSAMAAENRQLIAATVSKKAKLEFQLATGLPRVMADAGQVHQVLMNLVTNASEAITESSGTIVVGTGFQQCGEEMLSRSLLDEKPAPGCFVWLKVSDTGCGMDRQTVQRLFDPFFSTKFTGRGLGMPAVMGIVRAHRGAVLVESEIGAGTVVRVLLPAAMPPGQAAADDELPAPARQCTQTVLVVDDEEMVRELCLDMVRRCGYRAIAAEDGEQAIALFQRHAEEVACVLLDLTMPRLDGLATFEQLKRIRPDLPVIICSGYSPDEMATRFEGQGLAGLLGKPYQFENLRLKLQSVIPKPG
jgi:PAS domain S-box-containing protein